MQYKKIIILLSIIIIFLLSSIVFLYRYYNSNISIIDVGHYAGKDYTNNKDYSLEVFSDKTVEIYSDKIYLTGKLEKNGTVYSIQTDKNKIIVNTQNQYVLIPLQDNLYSYSIAFKKISNFTVTNEFIEKEK